jgi:AcrR family transcriptional regulator
VELVKKTSTRQRNRSPRVKRKFEQARNEILAVAQRLLLEGGAEAVTLAAVAGELRMTKQALYHYFPSKEALVRDLVTSLLDDEINELIAAIDGVDSARDALSTVIKAFYRHYSGRLNAFRLVYCQSQLYRAPELGLGMDTIRDEINPRTRHLFDVLEDRISSDSANRAEREQIRQLAFSAWLAALGLMTMLGIADANDDPLIHSDARLLETLSGVFDDAAADMGSAWEA